MQGLAGKVAIVGGAIGAAVVQQLVRYGAQV